VQTERDAEIVDWVGRLGAAGAEHAMARFGMGRSWAYARLNRLVEDGLLEQRQLLHRQPGLYVATSEGLRWCGLQRLGVHRLSVGGFCARQAGRHGSGSHPPRFARLDPAERAGAAGARERVRRARRLCPSRRAPRRTPSCAPPRPRPHLARAARAGGLRSSAP